MIDCELFSASAPCCPSHRCAGARRFTPHTQEGLYRGSFINHSIPYNPHQHISKQFLSLVDALESPEGMPRNRAGAIRAIPAEPELSVTFTPEQTGGLPQPNCRNRPPGHQGAPAGAGLCRWRHPARTRLAAAHYARVVGAVPLATPGLIGLKDDAELARDLKSKSASTPASTSPVTPRASANC